MAGVAIKALHIVLLGPVMAYALAAASGVLVGMIAGKPIWTKGAAVEGALKALFGGLVAAGLMYAARRWLTVQADLSAFGLGQDRLGFMTATAVPLVATILALVFEVDNLFGSSDQKPRQRVSKSPRTRASVEPEEPLQHDDPVDEELGRKRR